MEDNRPVPSRRRETRLLVVTIAVSGLMLFLLAKVRFPNAPTALVEPASPPLERLAARATYDELTGIVRGVYRQVSPAILTVPLAPEAIAEPGFEPTAVPAVRISVDQAIALIGVGRSAVPESQGPNAATILASDSSRGVVLFKVSNAAGIAPRLAELDSLNQGPGYAAAVEATPAGPAIRPLYYGRLDVVQDPRWYGTVLRLSALQQLLPTGAAVFTLDGRFIGLGFADGRNFIIVPSPALLGEAERLARDGSVTGATLGAQVTAITPALAKATGAQAGVVVTYVDDQGPAAKVLTPGDVVTRVGSQAVHTPNAYAAAVAGLAPNTPVPVQLVRNGAESWVSVTPIAIGTGAGAPSAGLGLDLRAIRGTGSEVLNVAQHSAAAHAGLLRGDLITAFGGVQAPDPAHIARMFQDAASDTGFVVVVQRAAAHLVVGLTRP
jgi:hypothetical protein